MKSSATRRNLLVALFLGLGLTLSSCVVYEPGPYYGHHEGGWRHGGWDHDRDHWR